MFGRDSKKQISNCLTSNQSINDTLLGKILLALSQIDTFDQSIIHAMIKFLSSIGVSLTHNCGIFFLTAPYVICAILYRTGHVFNLGNNSFLHLPKELESDLIRQFVDYFNSLPLGFKRHLSTTTLCQNISEYLQVSNLDVLSFVFNCHYHFNDIAKKYPNEALICKNLELRFFTATQVYVTSFYILPGEQMLIPGVPGVIGETEEKLVSEIKKGDTKLLLMF